MRGFFITFTPMSLLSKIIQWVQLLFKRIPKDLREKATAAKRIVDVIRTVIDHPGAVLLTELTKTEIDDAIRQQASDCLRRVSQWLGGTNIQDIPEILRNRSEKDRNGTLLKIGSELLACLDDNVLKENQYDLVVQSVVTQSKIA